MAFSWDEKKAAHNLRVHAVSFTEAATIFKGVLARRCEDAVESHREILVGYSDRGRLLLVVYEEDVEEELVRIISARLVTARERRQYEEESVE